jgi:uncharacterized membrane protein
MENFAKINSFLAISRFMLKGILYRKLIAKRNKGEIKLFQDPLFFAKVRYAKGEITRKQFNKIKKEILSSN